MAPKKTATYPHSCTKAKNDSIRALYYYFDYLFITD
jgi:hypothetical protein